MPPLTRRLVSRTWPAPLVRPHVRRGWIETSRSYPACRRYSPALKQLRDLRSLGPELGAGGPLIPGLDKAVVRRLVDPDGREQQRAEAGGEGRPTAGGAVGRKEDRDRGDRECGDRENPREVAEYPGGAGRVVE